jgi:CRP/FNR family transcriptional regulator, cyclic AMP receptor protein
MKSPYGLELKEDCLACPMRKEGYFCQLPQESLRAFERIKFTSSYPAGAVLFVEGQAPRGIYMICKGRVKLTMSSPEGKTLIARVGEAGEVLGLHSSISGLPYELSAEALEPCQINFVRREDFLKLAAEHVDVHVSIAQQLSNSYRSACQQIRYLGLSQSATEKLARFLLRSAAEGQETKDGIRIHLNLTHEEIAQIVGVARETVTRSLTELRRKAVISTKGASVVIRRKSALEAMAAVN